MSIFTAATHGSVSSAHPCLLVRAALEFEYEVLLCVRRELERLLPETARRHDLAQSAFIQPMRDDADARAAATAAAPVSFKASAPLEPSTFEPAPPPPRRVTVVEPPMDRLANPVTGYANLGRPRSVSSFLCLLPPILLPACFSPLVPLLLGQEAPCCW